VQPPSPAHAARLLGAAQHIREAIGTAIAPCERADHARTEAAARAALGEAAFTELSKAGAAEPLEEVLAGPGAHARPAVPPDAGRHPPHFPQHPPRFPRTPGVASRGVRLAAR
jgi:hypothetical protein